MVISPSMPDVTASKPIGVWNAGEFLLLLVPKPRTIADAMGQNGPSAISYDFTLAVVRVSSQRPVMFISIERSMFGTCCLGVFDENGAHHNLGSVDTLDANAFMARAVQVFRDQTGFVGRIALLGKNT